MSNIVSAAPYANLLGIQDNSVGSPIPSGEDVPMHLPMLLFLGERGSSDTQLLGGADLTRMYGVNSFDFNMPYANHATKMVNTINATGNLMMTKRLIPEDAKRATLRLSLELAESEITQYERADDGTFLLDDSGNKVPTAETKVGYKYRWLVTEAVDSEGNDNFGKASQSEGDLPTLSEEVGSTVRPVLDFAVTSKGAYGNNVGLSLECPTLVSDDQVDADVTSDIGALLYRLQLVERPDENSSGVVQETVNGERKIEFSFVEGSVNYKTDAALYFEDQMEEYKDDTEGFVPLYGPMDDVHFYDENYNSIGEAIAGVEKTLRDEVGMDASDILPAMMNFIDGVDQNGTPYYAIEQVGPENGGVYLGEGFYHYARGGADGDLSLANFDKMVKEWFENFEDGEESYMDSAEFPFSVFYDSGFTMDTKKAMLAPIGLRKDVYVVLSTQTYGEPQNTASEEQSIATALRTRARLYPESTHYGTATCRAIVVGQSGQLANDTDRNIYPMVLDTAQKFAQYMGAADGVMKEKYAFDAEGNNEVSMFKTKSVNVVFKKPRVRQNDWAAGLVWVQRTNRQVLFYPGIQTVYDEDTSILNSAANMMIAVELQKVCERVWRRLSGNAKLTTAQLIERSNELIVEQTNNRFDGRVTIVPETYLTAADTARGYSWSCKINMYGNNMPTVGTFTVTANRLEDLE